MRAMLGWAFRIWRRVDWWLAGVGALGLLFIGIIVWLFVDMVVSGLDPTPRNSGAWSPCQCAISGPCLITFSPGRPRDFYNDGTHPRDYDRWGQYTGDDPEVPAQCRPGAQ